MTLLVPAPDTASQRRLDWGERVRHALMFAAVVSAATGLVLFLGAASALSAG